MPPDPTLGLAESAVRALLIQEGLDEQLADAFLSRLRAEVAQRIVDDDALARSRLYEEIVSNLLEAAAAQSKQASTAREKILTDIKTVMLGAAGAALWDALKATPDFMISTKAKLAGGLDSLTRRSLLSDNFKTRWEALYAQNRFELVIVFKQSESGGRLNREYLLFLGWIGTWLRDNGFDLHDCFAKSGASVESDHVALRFPKPLPAKLIELLLKQWVGIGPDRNVRIELGGSVFEANSMKQIKPAIKAYNQILRSLESA